MRDTLSRSTRSSKTQLKISLQARLPFHVGIMLMPPPPPRFDLAGREPLADLENGPLVELSLLLRCLDGFCFFATPAPDFFPWPRPRLEKPPRPRP